MAAMHPIRAKRYRRVAAVVLLLLGMAWLLGDFTKDTNALGSNNYGYHLYSYDLSLLIAGEEELIYRQKFVPDAASLRELEKTKFHCDLKHGRYAINSRKFSLLFQTAPQRKYPIYF